VIGEAPGLALVVGQLEVDRFLHSYGNCAASFNNSSSLPPKFRELHALILYALMMYVILPGANPLMVDATPRGAFIVGHILYGLTFGLVAFALLRPSITAPSLRQAAA
jgi:hypothetical protein